MNPILKKLPLMCASLLLAGSSALYSQEGKVIYTSYCSGCHGANLEGGLASALIKSDWTYGRGIGTMRRNVQFGIPNTDMVAWGQILNPEQISDVVDYIVAAQNTPIDAPRPVPKEIASDLYRLKVEIIPTEGLEDPWSIEFIDHSKALISEKKGQLRWLLDGKLDPEPVSGLPETYTKASTGGYMDLALDPDYNDNGWIYLAYSHTNGDNNSRDALALTKIVRGRIADNQWVDQQTLFEAPDSLMTVRGNRWGCRFLFDKDGHLYFTIGDMAQAMDSQDPGKATGKVFRINPDGSIPEDNPFIHVPGALGAVYTLGNRNTQGLALHPVTGEIWSTDHGPMGGDELNILKNGANYGWPIVTYGVNYDGAIVSDKTQQQGMVAPVIHWTPSIAAGTAEFVVSPLFGNWKGNLLIGALAFEELRRLVIENGQVVEQEMILKGIGRVRDVKFGPDGALYVVLNRPDKILRIVPN